MTFADDLTYEEFEAACDREREKNQQYLDLFEQDLKAAKLSPKTISKHLDSLDLYLNLYLLREDVYAMEDGVGMIDSFLGYFYIRKCMWSTPSSIKTTAASIKKFYKSMLQHGKIPQEDYDELCEVIKENMDDWCRDCAQYNDPDADNPFDIFNFF